MASDLNRLTWKHRAYYRRWNEGFAAYGTYMLKSGWF